MFIKNAYAFNKTKHLFCEAEKRAHFPAREWVGGVYWISGRTIDLRGAI